MTMRPLVLLDCAECEQVQAFECPPCAEGHGDCPELACIECGTAVLLGRSDDLAGAAPLGAAIHASRASGGPSRLASHETAAPWSTLRRSA